jgi:beta-carotene isomerase
LLFGGDEKGFSFVVPGFFVAKIIQFNIYETSRPHLNAPARPRPAASPKHQHRDGLNSFSLFVKVTMVRSVRVTPLLFLLCVVVVAIIIPCDSFVVVVHDNTYGRSPVAVRAAASPEEDQESSSSARDIGQSVLQSLQNMAESLQMALAPIFRDDASVRVDEIVMLCDEIDQLKQQQEGDDEVDIFTNINHVIRLKALEFQRYELLAKLMRKSYDEYVATASFLSPSRIPRLELPNLQDVPVAPGTTTLRASLSTTSTTIGEEDVLVADCALEDVTYQDNLLDKFLLHIFRKLVAQNTGGVTSALPEMEGLVEQGKTYMINNNAEAQHQMVYTTLGQLMTPYLPPFYRVFMSGIIPQFGKTNEEKEKDGKPPVQLGPWFYAPWLTSIVTPTFFGWLVGPSIPNRRRDGKRGGLVVKKCKFLQISNCKGLCLHQCKLPAQQFFQTELGLPLTVSPNFVTQECQWSFGQVPVPPEDDPFFPKGCLVGCESRKLVQNKKGSASPCS